MSINIIIAGRRNLPSVALGLFLAMLPDTAMAQSIAGTATFRERMALPPAAVFEAVLEDVSRADAPAATVARTRVASPGNPPIAFTIAYDPARILPEHHYAVRARILLDGKLLFASDTATPVITRGNPTSVSILLRRVRADQTGSGDPPRTRPLEGTYWRTTELAGKPTPAQDANREAHLVFHPDGRVSGSDGCNRMTGGYQLKGYAVTFGQMAGTQMACMDTADIARAFRDALKTASRLTIAGDSLELFDATGRRVAAFAARAALSATPGLEGTSWQLVKFQGGDDTTLTPDDRAKYTIEFGADGKLTARIDCNRGSGTWKSSGPNQLQFGPLALTRAMCPAGSLHDRIVKQWGYIRSYVIRDGHLFLALMADGGIYEFEPLPKSERQGRAHPGVVP
jgi:heat shock protein HslJ